MGTATGIADTFKLFLCATPYFAGNSDFLIRLAMAVSLRSSSGLLLNLN